jgi:hypothetical protein
MKISELTTSAQLLRGMQIPVAISGENRAVELGQLLDAMAAAVVPFSVYSLSRGPFDTINEGSTTEDLPIIYVEADKQFYAVKTEYPTGRCKQKNTTAVHSFPFSRTIPGRRRRRA